MEGTFLIEEFKSYKVFLFSGKEKDIAEISIPLNNGVAKLKFSKGRLTQNTFKISGDYTSYNVMINADFYPNYIDLLRNEKPLFFYFNTETRVSYITTSSEPVGESEQ